MIGSPLTPLETSHELSGADHDVLTRLRRRRRREKPGSIVTGETILFELACFLDGHFGDDRQGMVLDVGAGTAPYRPLYERYFARCVATDLASSPHDISSVETIAPAESLPFDAEIFDAVICTEVLEHCADPQAAMCEIRRVLKPGGKAFVTTPFLVPLHEMPRDFYRYTPSALRGLAQSAELEVDSLTTRGDYLALMLGVMTYPLSKLFQKLSKITGVNLHRPGNPLIYGTLVLPQRMYFACWRSARTGRLRAFRRLHEKLNYFALGYVMVIKRPLSVR